MSKFSLIGGGISSCIIALNLLKNNHEVEIFEKKGNLGGILADYETNNNKFFRGCQYLDLNNLWFKEFNNELNDYLDIFEHTYGSYVEIDGIKNFSSKFAIPCFKKININLDKEENILKKPKNSMKDRFDHYPTKIKNFFTYLVNKHKLNPKELNFESAISLQMSRITCEDQEKEISILKTKNKIFDDIYSLERKKIFLDEKKLLASLPKFGFTELFKKIKIILENKGAKIYLNSTVFPKYNNNKFSILNNQKQITSDNIIWTGDPTQLIKVNCGKKLESIHVKILQTNADIINDFNFQTRYFQIFSDKKNITKIYLYKINNVKKMSVESFFIKKNSQEIINEAIDVLKNFNIKINVNADSLVQKVDSRFNIVSIKDEVIINEFLRKTESSNLLPGAWLIYGRDNKIHHYMNELKKRNFIN